MRVQIDVLKIDHSQPYHQPKWNQKAENCLCRNEGGSYAALHFRLSERYIICFLTRI